jgi:type VI secretion system protein ImpB
MDGKSGAEELIRKALQDPTLLSALVAAPKPEDQAGKSGEEGSGNG